MASVTIIYKIYPEIASANIYGPSFVLDIFYTSTFDVLSFVKQNSFGPHHYQLNHFKDDGGYCTKDTFGEYGIKDKLNTFSDGSRLGAINVHLSLIHDDRNDKYCF